MNEWDLALALCDVPDEFVMEAAEGKNTHKSRIYRAVLAAAAVFFAVFLGSRMLFVQGVWKYKITKIKMGSFQPKLEMLTWDQFYAKYPELVVKEGNRNCRYRYKCVLFGDGTLGLVLEYELRKEIFDPVAYQQAKENKNKTGNQDTLIDEVDSKPRKDEEYQIGEALGACSVGRREYAKEAVFLFQVDMEILREENLELYACDSVNGEEMIAVKIEDPEFEEIYYLYERVN